MQLPNGHSRSRLMKEFIGLGPYIREAQSKGHRYFFDCLAVCVSSKPAPEKREFWGWWMELTADEQGFTYDCQVGLYDKAGDWQVKVIKDAAVMAEIDANLKVFQQRLKDYLSSLNLELRPVKR